MSWAVTSRGLRVQGRGTIRFSRFGLIEKRPNSHWVLKGFTRDFALELTEVREMFELRSAARPGTTGPTCVRGQSEVAVADMVDRTSTEIAPWTLVEAEDKQFARVKVLRTVVDRLEEAL